MVIPARARWLLLTAAAAAIVAVAASRGALADDVVVPDAAPMHGPAGVACSHCHEDPHAGAGGAACQRCHGTEAWVPPLFGVSDHEATAFPLEGRHQRVACGLCHTGSRLVGLPTTCAECHLDRHRGKLGSDCAECHSPSGFTPARIPFDHAARTGFALTGPHALAEEGSSGLGCAACHQGDNGRAMRLVPEATCSTCHRPGHGDFGTCTDCHTPQVLTFAAATFDHQQKSAFPLQRRHAAQPCAACHPADAPMPDDRCQGCHVDPHSGQLGSVCADCHRPDRWRLARFDHDRTLFPLRGRHHVTPCSSCHTNQRWVGVSYHCWDCHAFDARRGPASVPAHTVGLPDCSDCHTSLWRW